MSYTLPPICLSCKHLDRRRQEPFYCDAFPYTPIPEEILAHDHDHRQPYVRDLTTDRGVQYEQDARFPMPMFSLLFDARTPEPVEKHMPGKHNQKAHGGGRREARELAHKMIMRARAEEPAITARMQKIAQEVGGELQGLEHRIKTESSLARKILQNYQAGRRKGLTVQRAAEQIKDVVRYTITVDGKSYALGVSKGVKQIKEGGGAGGIKNYWARPSPEGYVGYQGAGFTKSGYKYEFQMHTPDSFKAKMQGHELYERERVTKDKGVKEQLRGEMRTLYGQIPIPAGVKELPV